MYGIGMNEKTSGTVDPALHCSLCDGPLTVYTSSRGVTVRCEGACIPTCHENPQGFGTSPKAALEILKQKYKKV
jgi:hypothetical protein